MDERVRFRDRSIRLGFGMGLLARLASMASGFVMVPLVLAYLGPERYGLWMTVTAAGVFLGIGDFGLGYGVLTLASEAFGADDRGAAGRLASSAFVFLAGVALGLALIFGLAWPHVDWARVLGAPAALRSDASAAVLAFSGCFLLGLPLGLVDHLRAAHQETHHNGFYNAAGSVLGLALAWTGVRRGWPLGALVLVTSAAPLATRLANALALWFQRPWLRLRWTRVEANTGRRLMAMGLVFFVIQVGGLLSYQSDSLILAWRLGPASVSDYAVVMKLFMMLPTLTGLALMPLWPAYREAMVRHDGPWVRRTLGRSVMLAGGGGTLAAVLLAAVGRPLIDLWTGGRLHPDGLLIACAAAWAALSCLNGSLAMLLNGAHGERFQALLVLPATALNVAVSWWATGRFGPAGVLIGSLAATILLLLLPSALWARRFLRELETATAVGGARP